MATAGDAAWTADELARIGAAEELEIANGPKRRIPSPVAHDLGGPRRR